MGGSRGPRDYIRKKSRNFNPMRKSNKVFEPKAQTRKKITQGGHSNFLGRVWTKTQQEGERVGRGVLAAKQNKKAENRKKKPQPTPWM